MEGIKNVLKESVILPITVAIFLSTVAVTANTVEKQNSFMDISSIPGYN